MRMRSRMAVAAAMVVLALGLMPMAAFAQGTSPGSAAPGLGVAAPSLDALSPSRLTTQEGEYDLGNAKIIVPDQVYTSYDIKPSISVELGNSIIPLREDEDYRIVELRDNVNVGPVFCIVEGLGDYAGRREVPFMITPADISDVYLERIKDMEYTGDAIKPNLTLKYGKVTLDEDKYDGYTVEFDDNVNAGYRLASVTIEGHGSYTGTRTERFTITQADIGKATISSIPDQLYTGSKIEPKPAVSYKQHLLTESKDFTYTYSNSSSPGKNAQVTVNGQGNFTGSQTVYFTIKGADIGGASVSGVSSMTYTGSAITQSPLVSFNRNKLVEGVDYTVSYQENVNAGWATINIKGIGVYKGSLSQSFRIDCAPIWDASISDIPTQYYSGYEIEPSLTVTYGGRELVRGSDYTLSYDDNYDPGYATVTVTGIGNFTGSRDVDFSIARSDLSSATVALSDTKYVYTGSKITPGVSVSFQGRWLEEGEDYEVYYRGNQNAGTATVEVDGIGGYEGTVTTTFKITPASITRAILWLEHSTYTYNGQAKHPKVFAYYNGKKLSAGRDYKVIAPSASKNIGSYKAEIIGLGNYTKSTARSFTVATAPSAITKAKALRVSSSGAAEVAWKRVKNKCSGYQVWLSTSSSFPDTKLTRKKDITVNSTYGKKCSFRGSGLLKGTTYYVKVRTYHNKSGKKYFSEWSSVKTFRTNS